MPSPAELERVQRLLNRLSGDATGSLRLMLGSADQLAMSQLLADGWIALIEKYGGMAAEIGAEQFDQWATELGIKPKPVVAPPVDERRATARLGWSLTMPDQMGILVVLLDELVKQPYRSTMQDSALNSGGAWARVPAGAETCNWCLVLGSRGAVYHSKQLAQLGTTGKKYHGKCDCQPVLLRGPQDYPKGYDPSALYDKYSIGRENAAGTDMNSIVAAMRQQFGGH